MAKKSLGKAATSAIYKGKATTKKVVKKSTKKIVKKAARDNKKLIHTSKNNNYSKESKVLGSKDIKAKSMIKKSPFNRTIIEALAKATGVSNKVVEAIVCSLIQTVETDISKKGLGVFVSSGIAKIRVKEPVSKDAEKINSVSRKAKRFEVRIITKNDYQSLQKRNLGSYFKLNNGYYANINDFLTFILNAVYSG